MEDNKVCLSYTVMSQREDGKLMFLVHQKQQDFIFPLTCYEESYTGLAAVIELIKDTLNLNVDRLELSELTNIVIKEQRIPLFVFNYEDGNTALDDVLLPETDLKWQVFDNLKNILQEYEVSGAPSFD